MKQGAEETELRELEQPDIASVRPYAIPKLKCMIVPLGI